MTQDILSVLGHYHVFASRLWLYGRWMVFLYMLSFVVDLLLSGSFKQSLRLFCTVQWQKSTTFTQDCYKTIKKGLPVFHFFFFLAIGNMEGETIKLQLEQSLSAVHRQKHPQWAYELQSDVWLNESCVFYITHKQQVVLLLTWERDGNTTHCGKRADRAWHVGSVLQRNLDLVILDTKHLHYIVVYKVLTFNGSTADIALVQDVELNITFL